MPPFPVAIALGSNLGDRHAHIAHALSAIACLPQTLILATSPLLHFDPVGFPDQPAHELGNEYLNSAALLRTSLTPQALLHALHQIEQSRARDRAREPRWSARTLDLDILLYADQIIEEPGLTIPHPRMHQRRFVLEPLAAIAPHMLVPNRTTVAELLQALLLSESKIHA